MPGRHFLIKPAVCRAVEMKELFFPFLWDSRSQSSHALQQGRARVGKAACLRLWMSLWDSCSHLHYTTNKQRNKQRRTEHLITRLYAGRYIALCKHMRTVYVLKQPSSLSWYYPCNYHQKRWKRRKLERLRRRRRRERDRGRKKAFERK